MPTTKSAVPRNSNRLAGHGIPHEGRPLSGRNGSDHYTVKPMGVARGRTRCFCGEWSPELPSDSARRRWAREHKEAERAKLGRPTVEPLVFEAVPGTDDLTSRDALRVVTYQFPTPYEFGPYVELSSYDEKREHTDFQSFVGRKVRITVEVID